MLNNARTGNAAPLLAPTCVTVCEFIEMIMTMKFSVELSVILLVMPVSGMASFVTMMLILGRVWI